MVQENATENRTCSGVGEPEAPGQESADLECTTTSEPETYYSICITTPQGIGTMNRDELLEQLNFYRKLVEEQGDIIESLRNFIDEMHKDHKESQSYIKTLLKQIADLTEKLDKALSTIGNMEKILSDYDSRNDLNNQHRFGSRSQKGISPRKTSGLADRTELKDCFSVPEDIQDNLPMEFTEEEGVQSAFHGQNALGPHKRMEASRKVLYLPFVLCECGKRISRADNADSLRF